MTIFNLLLLVLVLAFSTESLAVQGCAQSSANMLWDQCPRVLDQLDEGLASRWKPRPSSPLSAPNPYDERLLVLQWPPSFCNTPSFCHYPEKFTVHGLWFNMNSEPVCCPPPNAGSKLKISDTLHADMNNYWPDLECLNQPENFWLYEYRKHGSCVIGFQKQEAYFGKAIQITKDIGNVMTIIGNILKRGKFYRATDFDRVIFNRKEFYPSFRCSKVNGRPYLKLREIVFCTYRNNTQKRCSRNVRSSYCEEFIFP